MRQLIGFAVGLVGIWAIWSCLTDAFAVANAMGPGSSREDIVLGQDFALRTVAGMASFVGGVSALLVRDVRAWLTTLSAFVFVSGVFSLVANRGNVSEWRNTAILLVITTGLSLCLILAQNQREETARRAAESTPPPLA